MDYISGLPAEILDEIAYDELTYRGLLAVPVFARSITIGRRFDFMIKFGHSCQIKTDDNDEYDEDYYKLYRIEWTRNNIIHRLNGPAIDCEHGHREWHVNGQLHRENGAAMKYDDGDRIWYWKGEMHRIGGPAYQASGVNCWHYYGKWHREDGPAIDYMNGDKEWWINDERHRIDGPAVISRRNGNQWWIHNKEYTMAEYNRLMN